MVLEVFRGKYLRVANLTIRVTRAIYLVTVDTIGIRLSSYSAISIIRMGRTAVFHGWLSELISRRRL